MAGVLRQYQGDSRHLQSVWCSYTGKRKSRGGVQEKRRLQQRLCRLCLYLMKLLTRL